MRTLLQVLSPDERARIHECTLHMLSTTGMRVDTALGRRILAEAGAAVDETTHRVLFPEVMVEGALRSAPKQFSLGARRPDWSVAMNSGRAALVMSGEATHVIDRASGEFRPSTHDDWVEATSMIDAVDEIAVYWATVEGCPMSGHEVADLVDYNIELMRIFSKHIQDSFLQPSYSPWVLEVLDIVFGGRDEVRRRHPYSFLITPVSPLVIEEDCTDSWLGLRGWDIPVCVLPMPMMGTTSPGSLLATTLLANCETLGLLCLVQAAEPGTPFIYGPLPVAMDPHTGGYTSNVYHPVLSAACTEMARHYGLPVMGSGSGANACEPGIQAGYEKTPGSLIGALAGPDLLLGPGSLGAATVFSLEQTLIDVEIFRMCEYMRSGITVSDDLWLDDVLARVGPGGHFMAEATTRANTHAGEWFLPGLGVHDSFDAWVAADRPTVLDQARQRADDLLAAREPLPLGDDVERELGKLREKALEADMKGGGRPGPAE